MKRTLVTVAFSHFCEKARLALTWARIPYAEERHLPMLHWVATFRAGGGRTVPVLVTADDVLADSTDILRWADRHAAAPRLLPDDVTARAECDALEELFDEHLGPAVRRVGYHCAFGDRRIMLDLTRRGAPRWQFETMRLGYPVARAVIRRAMSIDEGSVARARDEIRATFDRVAARLGSRARCLVGDRFSAADLTFAALAAPMVLPAEHPFPLPAALLPPSMHALLREFRAHPAGAFVPHVTPSTGRGPQLRLTTKGDCRDR